MAMLQEIYEISFNDINKLWKCLALELFVYTLKDILHENSLVIHGKTFFICYPKQIVEG
jgi:hypothetical protein